MADQVSLLSFPHNALVDGHSAMVSLVPVDLGPAELLLEMSQILVATQNSQGGKSFNT